MKALVTGGTGFIGSAIVRALISRGFSVRVLARTESSIIALEGLEIELVTGDLLETASLSKAVKNCDVVFHAAADYRLWSRDNKRIYDVNVRGTENIIKASFNSKIERFIYTSSVGTLGNKGEKTPGNEDTPVNIKDMAGHYKKSKFIAEKLVEDYANKGFPAVIVNPSAPVGPFDVRPTPTGKMIHDFLIGKMPAYIDTGLNIVDVDDVASGHLLAMDKGEIGRKYILGGENLELENIFKIISKYSGIPAPGIKLPYIPVLMLAYLNSAFSYLTGIEPRIPLEGVKMAKKKMFFSSDRAASELGYSPRPAHEAVKRSVDWFRIFQAVK